MHSLGQVATEYLITTTFLLVVIVIIFAFSSTFYTETVNTHTASIAVETMATALDQVRALGPNSTLSVEVEIPPGVFDMNIQSDTNQTISAVVLRLQSTGGLKPITKSTKGPSLTDPITKCILAKQGRYPLKIFWTSFAPALCVDNGNGSCQVTC